MHTPSTREKTEIFSTKEKEAIIQRIFQKNQIDSSFLYKGNGGEFYNKILESGKYRAYSKELELIDKYKSELQKYIKKYLTDIGCGNGEKAINLLRDHSLINNVFYIASDYSASLIELAEKNIKTSLPNVNMGNHQIMRGGNELFTNSLDDNTYSRLGCTIGNSANKRKIIEDIKNMNNSGTLKGNKIIFSYFDIPKTEEEIEKTKALYQNQEGKDFIFNGLQNLGIDTNKFDHIVDYDKLDKCIYISIQAKEDYEINLKNGQEIRIKKGEKFKVHKSQRFGLEEIKDILKQSGAKLEKHISEDGISIIVAKKDPKYYKKTIKIASITAGFLLLALGAGLGYQLSEYNQKKNQEEKNKELLEKTLLNKYANKPYFDNRERNNTVGLKMRITEATDNMYNDFLQIYGSGATVDENSLTALKNILEQFFLESDENGKLVNIDQIYDSYLIPEKSHQLLKEFVKEYSQFLAKYGFNTSPYIKMGKYLDACNYTQELKGNVSVRFVYVTGGVGNNLILESDSTRYQEEFNNRLLDIKKKNPTAYMLHEPPVHSFRYSTYNNPPRENTIYLHTDGTQYDVLILTGEDDKKFIVAHKLNEEDMFDIGRYNIYTKTNGESVAKDFLENWYTTGVSFEDNN